MSAEPEPGNSQGGEMQKEDKVYKLLLNGAPKFLTKKDLVKFLEATNVSVYKNCKKTLVHMVSLVSPILIITVMYLKVLLLTAVNLPLMQLLLVIIQYHVLFSSILSMHTLV